ncbi:hypothetical protein Lser_V15G04560 [Lactuca serriola]
MPRSGNGDNEVERTMLRLLNQLDRFEASNKIKLHGPVRTLYHNVDGDILVDQNHYMEVVDKDNINKSWLEPGWIIPLDIGPATQIVQ